MRLTKCSVRHYPFPVLCLDGIYIGNLTSGNARLHPKGLTAFEVGSAVAIIEEQFNALGQDAQKTIDYYRVNPGKLPKGVELD